MEGAGVGFFATAMGAVSAAHQAGEDGGSRRGSACGGGAGAAQEQEQGHSQVGGGSRDPQQCEQQQRQQPPLLAPPPPPPVRRRLASHVSEPPSAAAALRALAAEVQQQPQQPQQQEHRSLSEDDGSMAGRTRAGQQVRAFAHLPSLADWHPAPAPAQRSALEVEAAAASLTTPTASQRPPLPPPVALPAGMTASLATGGAHPATGIASPSTRAHSRLPWLLPGARARHCPTDEEKGNAVVVQHHLAGDLHTSEAATSAATATAYVTLGSSGSGRGDGGRAASPRPSKDGMRGSGGGMHRHSLGVASEGGLRRRGSLEDKPAPAHQPQQLMGKRAASSDGEDSPRDDLGEDLDFEHNSKPWWKKKTFWMTAGPALFSFVFLMLGIFYVIYGKKVGLPGELSNFQIWRVCFFLAGLPIIWWIGAGVMWLVVRGVERTMFTVHNALYYAFAVRRPMANVIRAALTLGWWALMMTAWSGDLNTSLTQAYDVILKLWACVCLFMTANLLKTLIAKLLSSKFHQASHFKKMNAALHNEYLLHCMLQPRQQLQELAGVGSGELEEEEEDGDLRLTSNGKMKRSRSAGDVTGAAGGHTAEGRPNLFRLSVPSLKRHSMSMIDRGTRGGGGGKLKRLATFFQRRQRPLQPIAEDMLEQEAGGEQGDTQATEVAAPPDAVSVLIEAEEGSQDRLLTSAFAAAPSASGPTAKPPRSPHGLGPKASPPPLLLRTHSGESVLSIRSQATTKGAGAAGAGGGRRMTRQHSVCAELLERSMSQKSLKVPASARKGSSTVPTPSPRPAVRAAALTRPPSSNGSRKERIVAEKLHKMEKYIRKNALEVTFRDVLSRTEHSGKLTTEAEAKKLAFYLFWNLKGDFDRPHVTREDLEQCLPAADVQPAFELLDADKDGSVSLQDCSAALMAIFQERRDLAASLKDTKTVVGKLETLIGVLIHIVMCFIYLLIFNVDVMKTYLALSSLILAFSFVFSNSLRELYENTVFLFVVHPFDVGDTLLLDGTTQFRVAEINLHYTTFVSGVNAKVWYPNGRLRSLPFVNLSASGPKGEQFKVWVDLGTPSSVLESLREAAQAVVRENPLEFNGVISPSLGDAANPCKMALGLYYEFSHNGADSGRTTRARNKMYMRMAETLTRLGVRYTWPSQEPAASAAHPAASVREDGSAAAAAVTTAMLGASFAVTGGDPGVPQLLDKKLL